MNFLLFIGPFELLMVPVLVILFLLFPLLALISILKNEFPGSDKVIWVLLVIFLPFLGSFLYFIIGRPKRIQERRNN
jgi:hypothetical protein